ncbi:hypothetical protein ACHAXN_007589 [Cyclotella atomus]
MPRSKPPSIYIILAALAIISPAAGFSLSAPTRTKFDTKVAVDGRSTVQVHPPPNASSNKVTLTDYMRLPVEQYVLIPMPLGSSLTRVEKGIANDEQLTQLFCGSTSNGDLTEEWFKLEVPTITFFNLSLQPVVYATVQPQRNRVTISSNKCLLHGSPFIEKVKLNDRFIFDVQCTLTWMDGLQSNNIKNENQPQTHQSAAATSGPCTISAETIIDVDVNVPRPFSSLPKSFVQKTGNAAMKLSMKYIQRNFVESLAKDYERWASDAEYRRFRALLSEDKIEVPLEV